MKCPKCNSENVQYSSTTNSTGYSATDGCCGLMILGPIGLLCGLCGVDSTTEEFWICHSCGNKFSLSEGKDVIEKEKRMKEEQEKIATKLSIYKSYMGEESPQYYIDKYAEAKINKTEAEKKYTNKFNELVNVYLQDNKSIKYYKYFVSPFCSIICALAILLGIVGFLSGDLFIILLFGIPAFIIFNIAFKQLESAKNKVHKILITYDETLDDLKTVLNNAIKNEEYWEPYAEKARYIKQNDK